MAVTSADRSKGAVNSQLFGGAEYSLAAAASETVDLRAGTYFVVYAASGTPTQQPCDEDGTVLAGTAVANVTRGALNQRASHFVKVTAPGAAAATVQVF